MNILTFMPMGRFIATRTSTATIMHTPTMRRRWRPMPIRIATPMAANTRTIMCIAANMSTTMPARTIIMSIRLPAILTTAPARPGRTCRA